MGWDDIRQNISRGLGWMQAREAGIQASGTTLEQALLEEIVSLDSSQADAVESLGSGRLVEYSEDGNVRPGELQRLQRLQAYFFGEGGSGGLFAAMRAADDPNLLRDPEL